MSGSTCPGNWDPSSASAVLTVVFRPPRCRMLQVAPMETARIAELLAPFTAAEKLAPRLLEALQRYLDLLLRWNARVNLTAVRDPERIVARHFGESLFAARVLLRGGHEGAARASTLVDVGSGAGFPGIPMKLFAPQLALTLIESPNKKAVCLRGVPRNRRDNGRPTQPSSAPSSSGH